MIQWYVPLNHWLVVWNMNFMTCHSVGNFIIPTDELLFFRGVGIPPTRFKTCIWIGKNNGWENTIKNTIQLPLLIISQCRKERTGDVLSFVFSCQCICQNRECAKRSAKSALWWSPVLKRNAERKTIHEASTPQISIVYILDLPNQA